MPIRFRCKSCNGLLKAAQRKAGMIVDCPKCKTELIVPNLSGPELSEPRQQAEVTPSSTRQRYGIEMTIQHEVVNNETERDEFVGSNANRKVQKRDGYSLNVGNLLHRNWKLIAGIGSIAFLILITVVTALFAFSSRPMVTKDSSRTLILLPATRSSNSTSEPRIEIDKPTKPIAADNQLSPEELFALCSPSVAFVTTFDNNGKPLGFGTGFLIHKEGLFATNFHVVEGADKASIIMPDKSQLNVEGIVYHSELSDIAVLKATGKVTTKPLDLAKDDLTRIGAKVYAIGNPKGLSNTLSDGLVSGNRDFDGINFIQTTTPISKGSSGGPLIGTDGKVIGLTTFVRVDGQNLNFAAPISSIRTAIEN